MSIVSFAGLSADHPARLVDLERYPIHDLGSVEARALTRRCHVELMATGSCMLPDFLTPRALAAMRDEARSLAPLAYNEGAALSTAYLDAPDKSLEEGHPRRRMLRTSVGAIAYDLVPAASPLRRLYEWDGLNDFIAGVVGLPRIYRYADPLGALNIAAMKEGDELLWHFDQTDFVTSILLEPARRGGEFEYVPFIRSDDDERYDRVKRLFDGDASEIVRLDLAPGAFAFFKGRHSIHRVTPIEGETTRLIALLGYDTRPGTVSSDGLKQRRYGRVA
ncbi:MAG: hypothetical protein K8R18_04735 [Parvibaculum sp.]|uniref:HalD/BesD family halogenase n=1 Tax=Parvibaculum sp. TaxID=2024848 RepID=UPI0025EAC8C3|nr:hypothetical protein [Parvibaculum sp.]MCE9648916.1 hypothetical protein [Parvibaculum sp.]